jgi:FtsH-binding integral membrane protein
MKKADEMEMQISLKSVRIAWAYSVLFLLVWAIYDFYQTQRLGLPFFLLCSQNAVLILSQMIIKRRVTAGNEE